jgi:hypothetical protein
MVYRKNKTIKKSKRKFIGGGGEETEIKYFDDDFILQETEGRNNKCLYYAFFRCKFGDLNKTNDDLSHETTYNIVEINKAVYKYISENLNRFTQEDKEIAHPDSEDFQTDAHVRALANIQNTIILIHEWTSPYQRDKKHFTVFEPRELDKEKEHTIIFMSNRTNNHYTALIPKDEEIYKKYAEQVKERTISPEEIKKTKPFLGADYGPNLSLNLQEPQPKTSSQIKSPPARAIRGSPRKGSVRDSREKQKVSSPKTKKASIKEPKRVGDDDAPVAPDSLVAPDFPVAPDVPDAPDARDDEIILESLSSKNQKIAKTLVDNLKKRRGVTKQAASSRTSGASGTSRTPRASGALGTSGTSGASGTSGTTGASGATGQEESELSQGPKLQAALPSTNLAHNINNAGRILPAFEPLPVLVGLVGLGVLLSSG